MTDHTQLVTRYRIFVFLFGGLFLLGLHSCQLPPNQGNGEGQGTGVKIPTFDEEIVGNLVEGIQDLSSEFTELAKPNQVQAWVSSLIVKAQPGKDMPQIATLKEGETAEYLYQRTVRKTEFTLRGQRYMEPWILVRLNNGTMGWVHEGGVRYVGPNLQNLLGSNSRTNTNPAARTRGVNSNPPANLAQNYLVTPGSRVGPITVNTSEMELIQLYGAANVGRATVTAPEKGDLPCTVVMPGTKEEIRITWKDDTRTKVEAIYFDQAGGRWYTKQGMTVGLSLLELTKVNKSPISFYGFNWTYSGTINSWRNGSLAPYENACYVVLSPARNLPSSAVQNFNGNQVFGSNHPDLGSLHLHISRMVVYLD